MDAPSPGISAHIILCAIASLLGWLPFVFTQPMMHGGSLLDGVIFWAGLVVGGYCTFELLRLVKNRWARLGLAVWSLPYAAAVAFGGMPVMVSVSMRYRTRRSTRR
jgi:hypothetical protein